MGSELVEVVGKEVHLLRVRLYQFCHFSEVCIDNDIQSIIKARTEHKYDDVIAYKVHIVIELLPCLNECYVILLVVIKDGLVFNHTRLEMMLLKVSLIA